jgi:AcrR family transcriptional regulator/DNA-binding XRE family transcriptional regulator
MAGSGQEVLDDIAVGSRVRSARQRCGRSLRRVAGELGISPASLSAIEHGTTRLTVSRLSSIAVLFGTTIQELLSEPSRNVLDARRGADRQDPDDVVTTVEGARDWMPDPGHWRRYPALELDTVLTAALQEFLVAGYHGTSVRTIAARCGMSVPGLYHHHVSKHALLEALLDHTMEDLLWRSEAARDEGRNPVERFALVIESLALFHTHRRELGFLGSSEMRSLEPAARQRIAALRTRQQRMVDNDVHAAVALGRFDTPRPNEAARAVVTLCTALPQWFDPSGPVTPEEIAARYVDYALDLMRFRRP